MSLQQTCSSSFIHSLKLLLDPLVGAARHNGIGTETRPPAAIIRRMLVFITGSNLLGSFGIGAICFYYDRTLVGSLAVLQGMLLAGITWQLFQQRGAKPRIGSFLLLTFMTYPVLQELLGGINASGGILVWILLMPLSAGFVKGRVFVTIAFLAFLMMLVASVAMQAFHPLWHDEMSDITPMLFLVNIIGVSTISFLSIFSFFHYVRDIRGMIVKQTESIASSIRYAKDIQSASLPSHSNLSSILGEVLLLYSPKDIVSGDFYWTAQKNGRTIVVVADCTGHGVPGGFMTMLGINSLNNIVLEKGITDPAMILHYLHWGIRNSFSRSKTVTDGMDISVCSIDRTSRLLTYSGAMSSLYHMNGSLHVYPSVRMSIGDTSGHVDFSDQRIALEHGDRFYMFSDGFSDQFGGTHAKRYGRKRMKDLLERMADIPMSRQQELVELEFNVWKGNHEQVDDVLFLGFTV
jgi:hypothetical protein